MREEHEAYVKPRPGTGSWKFAEFALYHAECAEEVVEVKVDEVSIVCWCPRCGVLRVLGRARDADPPGPRGRRQGCRAYRRCGGSNGPSGEG